MNNLSLFWVMSISAIIAAKWAKDLGLGQFRQLLWMIAGFLLGPFVLLNLYIRLLYAQQEEARRAAEMKQAVEEMNNVPR